MDSAAMSLVGTFETCQRLLKWSAYYGERPEVIGAQSERRD